MLGPMATLTMTGIIKIAIATCNQGDNRPTPVYLRRSIDLGIANDREYRPLMRKSGQCSGKTLVPCAVPC